MNFVTLSRGKEYPLSIRAHEGATANFLTDGGNVLQVAMEARRLATVVMRVANAARGA